MPVCLLMSVQKTVTMLGHPAWQVNLYADVRRLLSDDRLGRSHPVPENAARTGDSALFGGPLGNFDTEWADHARMRRLLQPHFAPKRMRALEPRVAALTAGLLDDLASPPVDLHEALALPLPILVICELLGVPYEDRDEFRTWTEDVGVVRDRARSERGLTDLFAYGLRLVARKRSVPGDDVMSRLCAEDGLTDEEIAGLSMSLLFAGHETTVVQIGLGVLHLLTHPGSWQALRENPDLVPNAVEELLRLSAKADRNTGGLPRYARTDLELDGVHIAAGDLVLLNASAANHDPEVFPEPDRCDLTRSGGQHLTFGHGPMFCLGAPLARIELRTVFSQLIARFPTMRLAVPAAEIEFRDDKLTGGLVRLPVSW